MGKQTFALIACTLLFNVCELTYAAPLELFGVKTGSVHRMALGGGEITARVVDPGKDGWVLFSITSDDVRWRRGTRTHCCVLGPGRFGRCRIFGEGLHRFLRRDLGVSPRSVFRRRP